MIFRTLFVSMLTVLFFLVTPVVAQNTKELVSLPERDAVLCSATPSDARLEVYPLASRRLSSEQGAGLGLRPVFLTHPLEAYNHRREINPKCGGTWVPEVILAGTLVWVNADGYVAYKGDCGNRLVWKSALAPRRRPRAFWQALIDIVEWPFVRYEE